MKTKISIAVAFFMVLAIGGCNFSPQKKKSTNKKEVIKIGAILPLTGKLSVIGEPEKRAMLVFNSIDSSFYYYFKDFKGKTSEALTVFQELTNNKENIHVFIASTSNACNVLRTKITNSNNILFANTSQPKITDGKNIFRLGPNTGQEINLIIDSLLFDENNYVIIYPNNELGLEIKNEFKNNVNGKVYYSSYVIGEKNFRNIIQKIPDSFKTYVFEGYPSDIPVFLKQLKESRKEVKKVILSMAALWLPEKLLKGYGIPLFFPGPKSYFDYLDGKDNQNNKLNKLIKIFENRYNTKINYDILYIWETLNFIEYTIEKNRCISPKIVQKEWSENNYKSLTKAISFSKNGDVSVRLVIREINGDND